MALHVTTRAGCPRSDPPGRGANFEATLESMQFRFSRCGAASMCPREKSLTACPRKKNTHAKFGSEDRKVYSSEPNEMPNRWFPPPRAFYRFGVSWRVRLAARAAFPGTRARDRPNVCPHAARNATQRTIGAHRDPLRAPGPHPRVDASRAIRAFLGRRHPLTRFDKSPALPPRRRDGRPRRAEPHALGQGQVQDAAQVPSRRPRRRAEPQQRRAGEATQQARASGVRDPETVRTRTPPRPPSSPRVAAAPERV